MDHNDRMMEIKEDIGYLKGNFEGLANFVKDHMEEEERKFTMMFRWMVGVSSVVILEWLGMSGPEILALVKALFV